MKPHVDEDLDKRASILSHHHTHSAASSLPVLCVCVCVCAGKELYNGLPDLLTEVAHEELERLPGLSECNITYLPQVFPPPPPPPP